MSGQQPRSRDIILIEHDFLRRVAKASGRRHEMSALKAYFCEDAKAEGRPPPRFDYFLSWFEEEKAERPAILRYADWLAYNGFKLHFKQIRRPDDVVGEWQPPNFNVEIAVEALMAARWARRIVVISDKYALAPALEALQRDGAVVHVAVFGDLTNRSLIRFADGYLDLAEIPGLAREDGLAA